MPIACASRPAMAAPAYPTFAMSDAPPGGPDQGRREPEPTVQLRGRRVLIVEDEFFVAIQIEAALAAVGCTTIGPFTTLDLALQASRREKFDIAVLDINLNRTMVYPLADELRGRGIPFVFVTGYSTHELPPAYRSLPRLQKPFDPRFIRAVLERALSDPDQGAAEPGN